MLEAVGRFFQDHQDLILVATIVSIALFLVSLLLMPIAVLNLPADHFVRERTKKKRPLLAFHILLAVVRNVLGCLFLIVGVLLLVLPGPGWLTILAGIALVDFPFKHKLELKVLSLPVVRKAVDSYRLKKNKPPLIFPEEIKRKTTNDTNRHE